jgi:hypothetical protein
MQKENGFIPGVVVDYYLKKKKRNLIVFDWLVGGLTLMVFVLFSLKKYHSLRLVGC